MDESLGPTYTDSPASFVVRIEEAIAIPPIPPNLASRIATLGDVEVELYAPNGTDTQHPHNRDELYFIARGKAVFAGETGTREVGPGDLIFVPAHAEHRFTGFTGDFAIWVLFFGAEK